MSKPSGMKLGLLVTNNKQPSTPPFQNEFLQNQQDQNYNQPTSLDNPHLSHSQSYELPTTSPQNQQNSQIRDTQQKRIKKLNNGMQKLSVSILEMKQKYKDLDMEEILFKKRSQKKENQIREFLSEKKKEKKQLMRSRKRRLEREAKSLQESINLEHVMAKNKKMEAVKESLNKLKQIKQKRQNQNKQQAEKSRFIAQMYQKIHQQQKKKPKYHLRKMEEQKKLNKQKEHAEKQYLVKRRQNFKPINLEELEQHGKKHDQLLQQLQSIKKAQKQQQYLKILQRNKKLQQFYRGHHYDHVLQQQEQRKVKKEEPTQKYKKMKNYQEYVRQNFIPKVQQKAKEEQFVSKHSSMSHREVRRYRYLQGVSYGEVVESRPAAKTEAEQRKLGNQYMAYMRSLPKRRYDGQFLNQSSDNLDQKLIQKKPNPLAERTGKKSVQVKLSDKPTREQIGMLINQLKNKDKQIKLKQKVVRCSAGVGSPNCNQKQIGDEIVFNIERKLNLLSKL